MTTLSSTPPVLAGAATTQAAAAESLPAAGTGGATGNTATGNPFSAVLSGLGTDCAPAEGITSSAPALPIRELVPALFAVTDNTRPGVQLPGTPALPPPEGGESLPLDGRSLPSGDDEASTELSGELASDPGIVLPAGLIEASVGPLPAPGLPSSVAMSPATAAASATVVASPPVGSSAALPAAAIDTSVQSAPAAAATASEAGATADLVTGQQPGPGGEGFAPDSPLPVEAQTRLHTMMAALDRTLPGPDPSTIPLPGAAAASSTAGAASPTAASVLPPGLTDLPALDPAADQQAWTQGLGERLLLMAEKGQQSATLRLQPEQLGPLHIHIRVDDDGVSQVLFSAHHAHTREAIEQALPRLRELFAEQGLNLAQADVDSGRRAFDGRDFTGMRDGESLRSGTPADAEDSPGAAVWQLRPLSSRRLDVLI